MSMVPQVIKSAELMSPADIEILKRSKFKDFTPDEIAYAGKICSTLNLSPFLNQIHFVRRRNKDGSYAVAAQVGIDGFRLSAQRAGGYAGSDEAVYEYGPGAGPNGENRKFPIKATVTVFRMVEGQRCPFTASVLWSEFYSPQGGMWDKLPHQMLGKCFDENTEVLTDKGFQKFSKVTGRILQVTDRGLEPTDAVPFSQKYDGEMVLLNSDDLNFCVTPNHDMVTTRGKIEAGEMYASARSRPKFWIPRIVKNLNPDWSITDKEIMIAAAYLADGSKRSGLTVKIEVSRGYKIKRLTSIGGYLKRGIRRCAGDVAVGKSGRKITTKKDKEWFVYEKNQFEALCGVDKNINFDTLMRLSARQAKLFVDTLIEFDGSVSGVGVERFYSSRPELTAAFELAVNLAELAVGPRLTRRSDISDRANYSVTISHRSKIPVIRWGREFKSRAKGGVRQTGLEITKNESGVVWCVTVPSGEIVVRRNGFSMRCGNCAEAQALRKAFPAELSGIHTPEEMDQASAPTKAQDIEAKIVEAEGEPAPAEPAPSNNALTCPTCSGKRAMVSKYHENTGYCMDCKKTFALTGALGV